jgi:hypothetical protein
VKSCFSFSGYKPHSSASASALFAHDFAFGSAEEIQWVAQRTAAAAAAAESRKAVAEASATAGRVDKSWKPRNFVSKEPFMKRVFTLADSTQMGLLKDMLEGAGIRCLVRNEQLSQTLPVAPFNAELWVENDEDFQKAHDLYQAWIDSTPPPEGSWVCPQCGERLKLQFDSCWKCGHKRSPSDLSDETRETD